MSYILQGLGAGPETFWRMISGMAGKGAGALVGGVEAIPDLLRGQGAQAGEMVRNRMQSGAEAMTPKKTIFAPTESFEAALTPLFETIKETLARGTEGIEQVRGFVGGKVHPALAATPKTLAAAYTLGEYMFEGPASFAPLAMVRGKAGVRPKPPEPPPTLQPAFEAIEPPPSPTGTSSGVPIKLDRLIAEAARNANPIEPPPNVRSLINQIKREGPTARHGEIPAEPVAGERTAVPPSEARPYEITPPPGKVEAPTDRGFEPVDWQKADETPIGAARVFKGAETRAGGLEGGAQSKIDEHLLWKQPQDGFDTAPVDGRIFDAGRERDTVKAKQDAVNEVITFFKENPELREHYPEFYNEAGQVHKGNLVQLADRYNTAVSTQMDAARRANEGQNTALHPMSFDEFRRSRGEPEPPAAAPEVPREPPPPAPGTPGELEPPPVEVPVASRKTPQANTLLSTIKQMGGIKMSEMLDLTGETRTGKGSSEIPGLFRKEGTGLDDLHTRLVVEKGFNIPDVQALREMIQDELRGKKHIVPASEEAEFQKMSDADAQKKYGPGTLGANPMFDLQLLKSTIVAIAKKIGGTRARGALNAVQSMPDSAAIPVAHAWRAANEIAAASERAVIDRITAKKNANDMVPMLQKEYSEAMKEARQVDPKYAPTAPKTVPDEIRAIEEARIHTAHRGLQKELLQSGVGIIPGKGSNVEGYVKPINYSAFTTPQGRVMYLRSDAAKALEQMMGAHDIATQRRWASGLGGAIEGISHAMVRLPMLNPMFHTLTTGGKAAAYIPRGINRMSILNPEVLKKAYDSLNNRETLRQDMLHGLRPWSRRMNMAATGAEVGRVEAALKNAGFEKPYEAWQFIHGDLLGNMVNFIQQAFKHMRINEQVAQAKAAGKTVTPEMMEMFKVAAARDSNLVGGNLPKEDLALWAYRAAGIGEFSRGLTTSTGKQVTRAISGDRIIQAYARSKGLSVPEANRIMEKNRNFMRTSLLLDYAMMQLTANLINYVATDYYDGEGKLVYENEGAEPSEKLFPRHIRVRPEVDDKGERTGRWVTMGSPIRNTRDMIEVSMLPFQYGLGIGDKPKILGYKASIPLQVAQEFGSRKDWAGRELSGFPEMAASAVGHVMPSPMGDLPMSALEAVRMESSTFFEDSIKRMFEPANAILTLAGAQPHLSAIDPETNRAAGHQREEENVVWSRAMRLKQMLNSAEMSQESRDTAVASIQEQATKAKMDSKDIHALTKYLSREGPSRSQFKKAEAQHEREREGQIAPPPRTGTYD